MNHRIRFIIKRIFWPALILACVAMGVIIAKGCH